MQEILSDLVLAIKRSITPKRRHVSRLVLCFGAAQTSSFTECSREQRVACGEGRFSNHLSLHPCHASYAIALISRRKRHRAWPPILDKNIRHRDIKPDTILIYEDQVKISDFGLSLNWADGQSVTTWSASPGFSKQYCAPENPWRSSPDIWSLGCVFPEVVTVLKRRSIQDLLDFISRYGADGRPDEEVYYSKPEALTA